MQIPADRMEVFSEYILDGERWMLRGATLDYSVVCREIVRAGKLATEDNWKLGPISPAGAAYGLRQMASLVAARDVPRRAEYRALAAALGDLGSIAEPRMIDNESVNSEGKQSGYLSDGVTLLYRTGLEYRDIFPVWDWSKLPGTTTTGAVGLHETGKRGQTTFDGAVSDGLFGVAPMELKHDGLQAAKSWFFFDEGYLALGAGITDADVSPRRVTTDVNQTKLVSGVRMSGEHGVLAHGIHEATLQPGAWLFHDEVGYIFPAGGQVTISLANHQERWSDIGAGSSAMVTLPIFNLWIDHGSAHTNAAYEYFVLPGSSESRVREEAGSPHVRTLANTFEVQAAWSDAAKVAEIVFRIPGNLKTPARRSRCRPRMRVDHQEDEALCYRDRLGPRSTRGHTPDLYSVSQIGADASRWRPGRCECEVSSWPLIGAELRALAAKASFRDFKVRDGLVRTPSRFSTPIARRYALLVSTLKSGCAGDAMNS